MSQNDPGSCTLVYASKLDDWDRVASVRAKPHRRLIEEQASGKLYFPPELVPVSQHKLVTALGEQAIKEVLTRRLYIYLDFTATLECDVVNRVSQQIAQNKAGFTLPEEMSFDAYKIYCDEGYHALFSVDLKRQIARATGVIPSPVGAPRFLGRLREIQAAVPAELRDMVELFFTIVSETLISAILSKIPKDERIVGAVREVIADHAEDEGRHHAYFSKVLEFIWPQLNAAQQAIIGPLLPQFILGFLEPDYDAIKHELAGCGLEPRDVEVIVCEAHPPEAVLASVREAAKASLRLFERNGLLAGGPTLEAFQRSGLVK